jgi:hypothetical protein
MNIIQCHQFVRSFTIAILTIRQFSFSWKINRYILGHKNYETFLTVGKLIKKQNNGSCYNIFSENLKVV